MGMEVNPCFNHKDTLLKMDTSVSIFFVRLGYAASGLGAEAVVEQQEEEYETPSSPRQITAWGRVPQIGKFFVIF